jgi:pimeloyl-ACP methyl ester carboxylesterase
MVLLHGWLDNCASFSPLLNFLQDYRVFALDFPGHGHSDHLPQGMAYHFLDLVYVIQDLVSHFQLSSFVLVGHSMGGAAATLFASVSDSVKQLVLLEALGPLTTTEEGTLDLMQKSIRDRAALTSKQRSRFESIEQAVDVRARHSKIAAEVIAPVVIRGLEVYQGGYRWRSDPRLTIASIHRLTEGQLQPMIKNIKCPVLLIEADEGLFANNALIQARKSHFQMLETHKLSGGHHVHMEHPETVAQLIIDFVEQG